MDPPPVTDIKGARILAELGDSITTDHISPAGSIRKTSPAGDYLLERQVPQKDFNSYGARRGNHEVMMRGTFANIRIRNEMLTNVEGGMTKHLPSGEQMPIYDAAMRYKAEGVPLVVFGGKEYGTGSSRDWAAKGTLLLGVKAVIVESFERIHRSNLVGMGVLPLTFKDGMDRRVAGNHRRGDDRHRRPRHHHAAHGPVAGDPPAERQGRHRAGDLPHRYGGRGGVLPARRHPALRAARDGEGGLTAVVPGQLGARLQRLSAGLNLQALSLSEGVRAALSVAVIIALNEYFQWPPLIEAALGALNTCMADPGGPIRRRLPVLLTFTLLGAVVVAGGGLARAGGIALALPLGVAGLIVCTFVRIYGAMAQLVGVLVGVMLILSLDRPVPDLVQAGMLALVFIGGCLWATVLTLVIWPTYPTLPARHAVADVYRALAAVAESLRGLLQAGATDDAAWDAHARTQLGAARTAIEAARAAVTALQRKRGGPSEDARHGFIRLEASEQLMGALIAAGDRLQHGDAQERTVRVRMLDQLRQSLLHFADAIAADTAAENRQIDRSIAAIAADAASLPENDPIRAIAGRVVELLRITYTLADPAHFLPGASLDGAPPDLRERLLQPLGANLNWRSPALRHALRLAAAATPALAFTMLWFTPYDHWLTITIVMTMQPYFGLTYSRVYQRILGTLAGGLVAALVGIVCTTPVALAVAMFPLASITMAARDLSYGLFIAWLTPLIVLLVDMSVPGASGWEVAGLRALLTVIGGGVAVAACFLLWPDFEPKPLLPELRDAIAAQGRYAASVLSHLLGEVPAAAVERTRREGGIATNTLETSISRVLVERSAGAGATVQAAMAIDAALRRCAGRVTAIMLDPAMLAALPPPAWRAWRDWIARSSTALAAGATQLDPRPAPANESVARIGRQLELIAGALERVPG